MDFGLALFIFTYAVDYSHKSKAIAGKTVTTITTTAARRKARKSSGGNGAVETCFPISPLCVFFAHFPP